MRTQPSDSLESTPNAVSPRPQSLDSAGRSRLIYFAAAAGFLCVLFWKPLFHLVQFALDKERQSYLLLVPFISGYLVWIKRPELRLRFETSPALSIGAAALAAIGVAIAFSYSGWNKPTDKLSLQILSLLLFLLAGSFAFIGKDIMRQILFPIAFMIFAVPVPTFLENATEIFLQHTSADAAYGLLSITGVPMLRNGLDFSLPGISIRVAQECSGFNSTFALFMVSLVAAHLFLKKPSRRAALALFVIPLAILRNGFRIMTIALLCVYVDPSMIDSYIHRKGGPIFFALSLIPFFGLLWLLRRSEIKKSGKNATAT